MANLLHSGWPDISQDLSEARSILLSSNNPSISSEYYPVPCFGEPNDLPKECIMLLKKKGFVEVSSARAETDLLSSRIFRKWTLGQ
jgi:hypothetical protein